MLNHLEGLQEYEKWWQSALLKSRRELKQQVGFLHHVFEV